MNKKLFTTNYIVKVAVLTAVSTLLMLILEFPIPFMPAFLKIDFSEIPVLVGGFALGPFAVVIIEFLKNAIHFLLRNQTMGIGEAANFIVGIAFAMPAAAIYRRYKTRNSALAGLSIGAVIMVLVAVISNYYVWLPLYGKLLGFNMDAIIGTSQQDNANIVDMRTFLILGIAPFNAIKAVILSTITFLIYKKLSPILHR